MTRQAWPPARVPDVRTRRQRQDPPPRRCTAATDGAAACQHGAAAAVAAACAPRSHGVWYKHIFTKMYIYWYSSIVAAACGPRPNGVCAVTHRPAVVNTGPTQGAPPHTTLPTGLLPFPHTRDSRHKRSQTHLNAPTLPPVSQPSCSPIAWLLLLTPRSPCQALPTAPPTLPPSSQPHRSHRPPQGGRLPSAMHVANNYIISAYIISAMHVANNNLHARVVATNCPQPLPALHSPHGLPQPPPWCPESARSQLLKIQFYT
jgi:hypothetical protein